MLEANSAGTLGAVSPALGDFLGIALLHHQAALDAWNAMLTAAGRPAVSTPPQNLAISINQQFASISNLPAAIGVVLSLERTAAATYLNAIGAMQSNSTIALAGSLHPIDRQHVSVLLFLLGQFPAPDTFADTDFAYVPAAAP